MKGKKSSKLSSDYDVKNNHLAVTDKLKKVKKAIPETDEALEESRATTAKRKESTKKAKESPDDDESDKVEIRDDEPDQP